jgi:hypothetical protein
LNVPLSPHALKASTTRRSKVWPSSKLVVTAMRLPAGKRHISMRAGTADLAVMTQKKFGATHGYVKDRGVSNAKPETKKGYFQRRNPICIYF